MTTAPPAPSRSRNRSYLLALKVTVTVGAFAYLLSRQSLSDLGQALTAMSPFAVGLAIAVQLFSLGVGAVRWRTLMAAYGARVRPSLQRLFRVYLVGYFYNTYLPFAVGGDVMRGVVSKNAFGERGATKGVAVVFVERALGLAAVLGITAIAVLLDGGAHFDRRLIGYCVAGLVGVALVIALLAQGRRVAPYLPSFASYVLSSLPSLESPARFAAAAALSGVTQGLVSLCGYLLVSSVWPSSTPWDSLLAMPLAAAASFFPLSVAGIGARDVALVALYGLLGVPRAQGTATAIAYLSVCLIVAGLGGLSQLLAPLSAEAES